MKPKNPNKLIRKNIIVTEEHNTFLESLGPQQASIYFRNLLDARISSNDTDLEKLKEELRLNEARTNNIKAQISEHEATHKQKQAASQNREQILEQAAVRIISGLHSIDFKAPEFIQIFKYNLEMIYRTLGSDGEPVTAEELKTITIKKAEAKEINVYE